MDNWWWCEDNSESVGEWLIEFWDDVCEGTVCDQCRQRADSIGSKGDQKNHHQPFLPTLNKNTIACGDCDKVALNEFVTEIRRVIVGWRLVTIAGLLSRLIDEALGGCLRILAKVCEGWHDHHMAELLFLLFCDGCGCDCDHGNYNEECCLDSRAPVLDDNRQSILLVVGGLSEIRAKSVLACLKVIIETFGK